MCGNFSQAYFHQANLLRLFFRLKISDEIVLCFFDKLDNTGFIVKNQNGVGLVLMTQFSVPINQMHRRITVPIRSSLCSKRKRGPC